MPKLKHNRKHSSNADKLRKHRRAQAGNLRKADEAPAERYNETPLVYTTESIPRTIVDLAKQYFKSRVCEKNALGGEHVYLEHAITKRKNLEEFLVLLASLVRKTMNLPGSTPVSWVINRYQDGTTIISSWILRYTGAGGEWHTDVFPGIAHVLRTWTVCVTLEGSESHFEISNRSTQRAGMRIWQHNSPVVIFQNHLVHRGVTTHGGSRLVLAAEFRLDEAVQARIIQQHMGQ